MVFHINVLTNYTLENSLFVSLFIVLLVDSLTTSLSILQSSYLSDKQVAWFPSILDAASSLQLVLWLCWSLITSCNTVCELMYFCIIGIILRMALFVTISWSIFSVLEWGLFMKTFRYFVSIIVANKKKVLVSFFHMWISTFSRTVYWGVLSIAKTYKYVIPYGNCNFFLGPLSYSTYKESINTKLLFFNDSIESL